MTQIKVTSAVTLNKHAKFHYNEKRQLAWRVVYVYSNVDTHFIIIVIYKKGTSSWWSHKMIKMALVWVMQVSLIQTLID